MDHNLGEDSDTAAIMQQVRVRACDLCRRKKVRCEAMGQDCLQCINYGTHCRFTSINREKRPRKPPGYKRVEEMENRLKRMEALLKASGKMNQSENALEIAYESSFRVIDLEENEQNADPADPAESEGSYAVPGEISANPAHNPPELYHPSTALSIPSKLPGATRNPNYECNPFLGPSQLSTQYWNYSPISDVFPRNIFQKLPPKPNALSLIEESFQSFNASFPIFDQYSFMKLVQERYSNSDQKDPGWWACLNVVLTIAHIFRAMRTLDIKEEDRYACGYMQNALAVVSELTMQPSSLFAVQALLAMTIVLRGTPNSRLCSMLIGATIRLAQNMGLHKRANDSALSDAEIEQRKRVFWIAYLVDKDISLRTGQPPAQDDNDMDADLPLETVSDLNLRGGGVNTFSILNLHIGLAMIQGQIYKRLYTVKGMKQSEADRLLAAQELDTQLAGWKSNLPIDFEADYSNITLRSPIPPTLFHKIILHFTYINCLIAVHRPFWDSNPASSLAISASLSFQASTFPSESTCVTEARNSMRLIRIIPQGNYASIWLLICILFAAVTTLFHNILRNPSHVLVQSDLELVEPFLKLLEFLLKETHSEEVKQMYKVCYDLNRRAKEAVVNVNVGEGCSSPSRMDERESVEEFIRRIENLSGDCRGPEDFESLLAIVPTGEWTQ